MRMWLQVVWHPILFLRAACRSHEGKRRGLPVVALISTLTMAADYPQTPKKPVIENVHGIEITDPYRWLEDQESPETRAWLEAQVRHTRSILATYPGREAIHKRMAALEKTDRTLMPRIRNGHYVYRRRPPGAEQYSVVMRKGLNGKEEVLIAPESLSQDGNTSATIFDVSADGSLMAFGIRDGGQEEVVIRVMQTATRENLSDVLPKRRYLTASFKPDKSGLYYTMSGDENPRLYEHNFGEDHTKDRELFGKGYGAQNLIAAEVSEDGRWLMITVLHGSSAPQTDLYCMDLRAGGPIRPVFKDIPARFFAYAAGERWIVLTNDRAPFNRVISVDPLDPAPAKWREVIPQAKAPIEALAVAGGKIAAVYLEDVNSKLRIFHADGKPAGVAALPAPGSIGGLAGGWQSGDLFYNFDSFHYPPAIYRLDMKTNRPSIWAKTEAPLRPEDYELKQVFYKSKDGATRIPMFLLSKRGVKPDGNLPVLLYGYGGFTVSMIPAFSPMALTWADSGGVYAVANIRGGNEYGEDWHTAGTLEKKQNVFDDFIAAAEWLIENKYTNPKRLAIRGVSNGGLLVGAAMTQRPELFQAVVCQVPLLDMMRYHKFLVARFWVPEYGSSDDPEQARYLYAYSPYHNVKPGVDYPATMFVTGDGDTRVAPLHARKMAALLQANTGGKRPVLLHYDNKAGHSAGMAASKRIDDDTDIVLFLLAQLGVKTK
jgi:prolyl oligopeptidase